MTPEQLNAWRIIPRVLMFAMIGMTYRTVEWFMSLPDPNPEQAALVSVMTGALTGAFGLFLGKKERDLVKQVNDELIEKVIGQQILYYPKTHPHHHLLLSALV
mgnify:CR=1 FL=1